MTDYNSVAVAPFPIIALNLISATLVSEQISGTGFYKLTIQGLAQFSLTDGNVNETISFSSRLLTDGNVNEVITFSH